MAAHAGQSACAPARPVQHHGAHPRCLDIGRSHRPHPVGSHCPDPAGHGLARLVNGVPAWRWSPPMMFGTDAGAGRLVAIALSFGAVISLCGCDDGGDPKAQIGANPTLPSIHQYLLPPVHIAKVVGWKQGETPTVAQGLKVQALATGLEHPRSLYVLPNGDILVVESKAPPAPAPKRPKDIAMALVESWATSGGSTGPSNRITLLRDANNDGVPEQRSVFLDHLNSPFGVALVGND